jgi:hypothetical protein
MHLTDIDINKTYSYADYYSWTFDERVELINGKLFNLESPQEHYINSYQDLYVIHSAITLKENR